MALIGNLKDIKLPSLIQLNCMEHNSAKLTIERAAKFGFIYFEEGQVTHAEYDPYIGEEAVFRLLALLDGKFKVENGVKPPVRTIETNWSNLLLEGMHKIDHSQDEVENRYYRLFERLLTIKGVLSVSLNSKEGVCIDKTEQGDAKKKDPNVAFIMLQAQKLSKTIGLDHPEFVSIFSGQQKYFFAGYNEHFLLLQMDKKVKSDVVIPLIQQAIGLKEN
ncbi:MAG: DUF4388 domain-containing protein [Calditrichaeota bacterium]|nr:MAG: DUF4388 domain-containing protein [Calditrichota bacterium]MBL1207470.1 DUF4388 domain-containing protein [Calditrichota bacterium]NOG47302.1 DUF4388 domain-containing protein [Calditrichota bacterium]